MTHRARKRFGQHFLNDDQIIDRIVHVIDPRPNQRLVEIGPGLGAMTRPVLEKCQTITVVELDRDVIPHLQKSCASAGELNIVQADALNVDLSELKTDERPLRIIGNLPYNISTPLIFHFLQHKAVIQDMHFMLQREVVDRLAAKPGTKDYGRLSVMVQYHCQVEPLFLVPPTAFDPPPKVDSAIVRLIPYANVPYPAADEKSFAHVVLAAFSQRRKTIRNTLKNTISADALTEIGIDPHLRAENLSVQDFVKICNYAKK